MRPSPTRASIARVLFAAALLALSTLPSAGRAQAAPGSALQLEWTAPPECPTRDWLLGEIARLLGRPLGERASPLLRVTGAVSHATDAPYRVTVRTESSEGSGERSLEDSACERVAEATAVVIALAIDPEAVAQAQERRMHPPPPRPVPQPQPAPRPRVPPPRLVRFVAGAIAAGDLGTLPGPTVGFGAYLALLLGPLVRVELGATSWLPRDVLALDVLPETAGAHVRMVALGVLRACLERRWTRVELGGCLGVEGGALAATGFGISDPSTGYGAWFAGMLGPAFTLNLASWIALRLTVDAVVAPVRPTFTVRAYRGGDLTDLDVYQPSVLVGRAGLAVELRY